MKKEIFTEKMKGNCGGCDFAHYTGYQKGHCEEKNRKIETMLYKYCGQKKQYVYKVETCDKFVPMKKND